MRLTILYKSFRSLVSFHLLRLIYAIVAARTMKLIESASEWSN